MNDKYYSEVLGPWTETLPEDPQECLCLRVIVVFWKVPSGGGSDWLSDLPKVTAVSQAEPQVSFVLLWAS